MMMRNLFVGKLKHGGSAVNKFNLCSSKGVRPSRYGVHVHVIHGLSLNDCSPFTA